MSFLRNRAPLPYAGPQPGAAALWLLAALAVQATLMHYAIVRGAEPSIVLVTVVWYAMRAGVGRAALFGLIAGVGEDLIAFDSGAAWTISTTLTASLAALPTRRFFEDSTPFFLIITAFATLVRALIFWSVRKIEGFPVGLGTLHFHQALVQAALNVALAALVTYAAQRFGSQPRRARR